MAPNGWDLKPSGVGVVIAALNVLVIGIGIAVSASFGHGESNPLGVVFFVCMFAMVPAVVLGALLGWLAGVMAPLPVWLRRCVLVLPAMLLVIMLGAQLAMQEFILVSCIPTTVAVFVLERVTRLREPPPVPVAVLHRTSR